MNREDSDRAPVTFQDVADCFSEEEWKLVHQWQKELYRNVMKEIHQALTALGPLIATSVFSLRAKEKEDLCFMDQEDSERRYATNQYPSDNMIGSSDDLFAIIQAGNQFLIEPQDTDGRESNDGLCTESTSFDSGSVLKMHQDLEASYMDHSFTEGGEGSTDPREGDLTITQVVSLTIKEEEEDDYFTEHQHSQRRDHITIPTCDPVVTSFPLHHITHQEEMQFKEEPEAEERSTAEQLKTGSMKEKAFYTCSKCMKNFTHKSSFQQHQSIHSGRTLHHCTECEKSFTNKTAYYRHQKIHVGIKQFTCTKCDKSFTQKKALRYHQSAHTGVKPYPCDRCEKSFAQKTDLVRHERTHTGEKPFPCTKCDKRFTQKICLLQHLNIHMDEKPYPCTECEMRFTQKTNLINHLRIHTGERPFSCSECEKTFTNKGHLVRHQVIHTGVKPFPCTECGKSFSQKTDLQRHQRIHTGTRPFPCTECERSFTLKAVLLRHQKIHRGASTQQYITQE